jgi:hypothetical protein
LPCGGNSCHTDHGSAGSQEGSSPGGQPPPPGKTCPNVLETMVAIVHFPILNSCIPALSLRSDEHSARGMGPVPLPQPVGSARRHARGAADPSRFTRPDDRRPASRHQRVRRTYPRLPRHLPTDHRLAHQPSHRTQAPVQPGSGSRLSQPLRVWPMPWQRLAGNKLTLVVATLTPASLRPE